ncbi:putative ribonuclease H-like domain-containing protein [Tanacetum coccineum]|uniref:Ribonuclease H-like domain-containing protein n=1 Tax=Tanacetum coccineum TaxID=301880 RepID=A0ABQ4YSK7_9ASTR
MLLIYKKCEGYMLNDLKLKEFDYIQEMFDRAFQRVNTFKDFRTELVEGKEKREGTKLEPLRRFHGMDDAKEIWEAIRTRKSQGALITILHVLTMLLLVSQSKSSTNKDLLHEDLEQIDDLDIEEMDINWQIAMIAIRMKKFYKEKGRGVLLMEKHLLVLTKRSLNVSIITTLQEKYSDGRADREVVMMGQLSMGENYTEVVRDKFMNLWALSAQVLRTNVNPVRPRVNTSSSNINTVKSRQPVPVKTSNSFSPKRPQDHPLKNMVDRGIFDSGCSGHMTVVLLALGESANTNMQSSKSVHKSVTGGKAKKSSDSVLQMTVRIKVIGTKWVYKNKRDERGVVVRNKARLVAQGYTLGRKVHMTYDEFFASCGKKNRKAIRLQVKQNKAGIFISQVKYVAEILKKFDLVNVKTEITPMETIVALIKDKEALVYSQEFTSQCCERIFKYLKGKTTLWLWWLSTSLRQDLSHGNARSRHIGYSLQLK